MAIQTNPVAVVDLRFDPQNPRLPEDLERTQIEMFRFIVREVGVDDLLDSLSISGVIEGDPVIARQALPGEEAGHLYVIEGNRRLAALKLLTGEKLDDGEPEKPLPVIESSVVD